MQSRTYEQWKMRLANSAKISKIPIMGQYELTGRCNLDCKMCYVHNLNAVECQKRELSTMEWKRIFDEAIEQQLLFATLTGGECLLRPDFKELYLHLWKKGVRVTVLTNGILLDQSYVNFFKNYKPERIQISLYGSNEEGYRKVTGHGGFEKATCAIRNLMASEVNVTVVSTPSRYMGEDYIRILQFCRNENFPLKNGELILLSNRDDPNKEDYFLSMQEIETLSKQRAALYKSLVPLKDTPEPCGPMLQHPAKGLTCSGGTCLACVTWDGVMYPCVNAMVGGGASLREMSYADAWKHTVAAATEVLHGMECAGCPYDKVCPKCPALRLTGLDTGHCNKEICKLTRSLVAAGVKELEKSQEDDCEE